MWNHQQRDSAVDLGFQTTGDEPDPDDTAPVKSGSDKPGLNGFPEDTIKGQQKFECKTNYISLNILLELKHRIRYDWRVAVMTPWTSSS